MASQIQSIYMRDRAKSVAQWKDIKAHVESRKGNNLSSKKTKNTNKEWCTKWHNRSLLFHATFYVFSLFTAIAIIVLPLLWYAIIMFETTLIDEIALNVRDMTTLNMESIVNQTIT